MLPNSYTRAVNLFSVSKLVNCIPEDREIEELLSLRNGGRQREREREGE